MDVRTPSCGCYYADKGSYLSSKDSCRPRRAVHNNGEIYVMTENPITSYNHRGIISLLKDEELLEFGEKGPCELDAGDMQTLKLVCPKAYVKLQLWYWALLMHNNITLQLGWIKMSYNSDGLTV